MRKLKFVFLKTILLPFVFLLASNAILKASPPAHSPSIDSLEQVIRELDLAYPEGSEAHIEAYYPLLELYAIKANPKIDSVADLALGLAEKYQVDSLKLQIYFAITNASIIRGDFLTGLDNARKGENLAQLMENPKEQGDHFSNVQGIFYARLEDYENAANAFLRTLKYIENNCDLELEQAKCIYKIAQLYNNLGTVFLFQDALEEAGIYYKKAFAFTQEYITTISDTVYANQVQGAIYSGLGQLAFKKEELDSAEFYTDKSIDLLSKSNNLLNLAQGYQYKGDLYLAQGHFAEAEAAFQKSIGIQEENKFYTSILPKTYLAYAKLLYQQGQMLEACDYIDKAIPIAEAQKSDKQLADIYHLKVQIFRKKGDYKEIAEATQAELDHISKFYKEGQLAKVEALKAESDLSKSQSLLAQKDLKLTKLESQANKRVYLMWIIGLAFGLALLFVGYSNQVYKQTQKTNALQQATLRMQIKEKENEIYYKNKELVNVGRMLLDRSNLIQKLEEELTRVTADQNISMADFWKKFNIDQMEQADIDKFQVLLDDVSVNFFATLSEKFPELNEADKRLCVMIKLGWNSNDIATLENSTPSAIRTRKSRLKKKMELSGSEDLQQYLEMV